MTDLPRLDPTRTALLVMDYQAAILDRLPGAPDLLERVAGAVTQVRALGAHVGWVRVGFTDADFDAIPARSAMARSATPERRALMHADAAESQVHERLAPEPADLVVRKTRVGAFSTTDLDAQLHARGVDTLVLAGVSTSGVVLSTVREAMDRDYAVLVLADASADPDPEVHAFLTTRLFPRHARVVRVDDLPSLLARPHEG